MSEFKKLKVRATTGFHKDIMELRVILNANGYDAEDSDIAQAYANASENEYSCSWMDIKLLSNNRLLELLLMEMCEV
jgi:hypothetical protein